MKPHNRTIIRLTRIKALFFTLSLSKFIRKYTPAKFAGKKFKNEEDGCTLYIPEGDSAESTVKSIITSKNSELSLDYCGLYNIQGVPPNAKKETTLKKFGKKEKQIRSKMLENNISFNGLMDALGLDYDKKYNTKAARQTLNYKDVVIATDQDVDGIGKICSLILVWFMVN